MLGLELGAFQLYSIRSPLYIISIIDDKFVWKKKQEKDGLDKLDETDRELFAKMKEKEKKIELWKVRI